MKLDQVSTKQKEDDTATNTIPYLDTIVAGLILDSNQRFFYKLCFVYLLAIHTIR